MCFSVFDSTVVLSLLKGNGLALGKSSSARQRSAVANVCAFVLSNLEPLFCIASTHMKNCEPFVFLPRLAIESKNGLSCFNVNSSSEKI